MKYCATCGSELDQGGNCPNCQTDSKAGVLVRPLTIQGDWIALMIRFFLVTTALSTFLYILRWPQTLVTNPRLLTPDNNIYFLLLTIALLGTVALALTVRNNVALVSGYFLAGLAIWVLPDLILSIFGQDSFSRVTYTPGALDNLIALILTPSNLVGSLPEILISIGFYLFSFAHLPVSLLGFFAIAQESISKNLTENKTKERDVLKESPLAIGAFIAAFLVPLAGIILSVIGILKWREVDARSRGLLVSALGISILSFLVAVMLFFGIFLGFFAELLAAATF